jgi:hypothetical protein
MTIRAPLVVRVPRRAPVIEPARYVSNQLLTVLSTAPAAPPFVPDDFSVPVRRVHSNALRTWINAQSLALTTSPSQPANSQSDNPPRSRYPNVLRFWSQNLLSTTLASGGNVYSATLAETGSATDALTSLLTAVATLAESGAAADSLSSGAGIYSVSISESGTASDTLSSLIAAVASLAEGAAATDTLTNVAILAGVLSEAAAAAETLSSTGAVYSVSFAEAGSAADAISSQMVRPVSITETGSAADVFASIASLGVSIAEIAAAIDTFGAGGTVSVSIIETANASDSIATLSAELGTGGRVIAVPYQDRTLIISYQSHTVH